MKCPGCSQEYIEGQKFCKYCGMALITSDIAEPDATQNQEEPELYIQQKPPKEFVQPDSPGLYGEPILHEPAMLYEPPVQPQSDEPLSDRESQPESFETDQAVIPTVAVKKRNVKPMVIILPIIVLIIAASAVFFFFGGGKSSSGFDRMEGQLSFFNGEEVTVAVSEGQVIWELNEGINFSSRSMDGMKTAVITNEEELWVIINKDITEVAGEVAACVMSNDGGVIAYIADYDEEEDGVKVGTLYLYDIATKNSTEITKEAYIPHSMERSGIILSPDGKTVGYIGSYKNGRYEGYLSINGKEPESLGKNKFCAAVSNNAKYLYTLKNDGSSATFYVQTDEAETKLASKLELVSYSNIFFSKDYSQVIYSEGGKAYISKNGGEKERINGNSITGLVSPYASQFEYRYTPVGASVIEGINNFAGKVAIAENDLIYINNKYEVTKIKSNYSSVQLSESGNALVYSDNRGNLYKVSNLAKNPSDSVKIGKNPKAEIFTIAPDASEIYYVNEDEELWYVSGDKDPVKVSGGDDVYSGYLALDAEDNTLYFLMDYDGDVGTLCRTVKGSKRETVSGADSVSRVFSNLSGTYYFEDEDDEVNVYSKGSDKEFAVIIEDLYNR